MILDRTAFGLRQRALVNQHLRHVAGKFAPRARADFCRRSDDGAGRRYGGRIVTTCFDHSIRIWDASSGRPASESIHVAELPRFAAFSPDTRSLLTGLGDNRVRLWRVPLQASGAITFRHGAPVQSVHFSPDGNLLVTVDGLTAQIWDIRTGRLVAPPLKSVTGGAIRVHFSPDGEWIAT